MSGTPNSERNAAIVRLHHEEKGEREIARMLQLSPSIVAGVLHRAGLTQRKPGRGRGNGVGHAIHQEIRRRYALGEGATALAREYGLSRRSIYVIVNREQRWTA